MDFGIGKNALAASDYLKAGAGNISWQKRKIT
jgi:hypothetical protein